MQLSNRDFTPVLSEKLKNLGYDFNHDITSGTQLLSKAQGFFDKTLNRKTKGRKPFTKELDYRAFMTQDTIDFDRIVAKFDMTQYRAEMYEVILNQVVNQLMNQKHIRPTDSRHYGPGRIFIKGA